MIANYHTHTWRCNHAEQGEEAYVQQAYAAGIRVLGFSDHAPQPFRAAGIDYTSSIRMTCEQFPDYMHTLIALKKKYKGEIDIHIGFEAEYYPKVFPHLLEMVKEWEDFEYLILGQHFLGNEMGEAYCGVPTDDPHRMHAYVEQCKQAMDTGAFSYFAHPDMIRYTGDSATYRREARALCAAAKAYGVPLEFNLLGYLTRRHYPTPMFWEEAAVVGNKVILGLDAHAASWMKQPQGEADARAYLTGLGLPIINFLTLMSPHDHRK